jgi:putative ABC transport system ATP-binding protein
MAESSEKTEAKNGKSIVTLKGIDKTFYRGKEPIHVLEKLDLDVPDGSFEALMGPSGSGKSTLLNIIAGLDRPTSGSVNVSGSDLTKMSDNQLAKWRSQNIGFIFQSFNLIPVLTAAQNVELPLLLTGLPAAERRRRAAAALALVGLADRVKHKPAELSGGQEQRVGIARAIVTDPDILLADEPTGDLDRRSGDQILELLQELNRRFDKTIVMVTHDPHAAARAKRTLFLNDGLIGAEQAQ